MIVISIAAASAATITARIFLLKPAAQLVLYPPIDYFGQLLPMMSQHRHQLLLVAGDRTVDANLLTHLDYDSAMRAA